jgi:hypothetical protein
MGSEYILKIWQQQNWEKCETNLQSFIFFLKQIRDFTNFQLKNKKKLIQINDMKNKIKKLTWSRDCKPTRLACGQESYAPHKRVWHQ